jgi:hypothetical protein
MNLNELMLDSKLPANINYVKARCAIEEAFNCRRDLRAAKLAVIEHLNGTIKHPTQAQLARGATKQVLFPDNTKAKF